MQDYPLVGCGHCGVGIVPHLAPTCPFRQEPVCETCYAAVLQVVTTLRAQGRDPLARPRRQRRTTQTWRRE
jgi:hypothetical protein